MNYDLFLDLSQKGSLKISQRQEERVRSREESCEGKLSYVIEKPGSLTRQLNTSFPDESETLLFAVFPDLR
jgi:hypothetical protein